jgi:hypothetical protein
MNCPNCHQPTAAGAAFCGNCGQTLQPVATPAAMSAQPQQTPPGISPIAQNVTAGQPVAPAPIAVGGAPLSATAGNVPAYALATPAQHVGETKALLALIFGILGIIGSPFMALIGLVFGIAGIVLGTMSRHSTKRGLSTVGIVVSSLAIVAGLAVAVYASKHTTTAASHALPATSKESTALSTPCYSVSFSGKLNVSNSSSSCDMAAFNGSSLETSSEFYKVYANKTTLSSENGFADVAKTAIEKDVKNNLVGFTIDSESLSQFSGSTAYVVKTSDSAHNIAVVEAAVYHPVGKGENVFVVVHALSGTSIIDLSSLESQWQWK